MYQVTLKQVNKQGKEVFSASVKRNYQDKEIETFSKEIAEFCKDVQALSKRSKKRGVNTIKLRQTLPAHLELMSLDENDNFIVKLSFNNFGKFIESKPKASIAAQLKDSAEFIAKYSDMDIA